MKLTAQHTKIFSVLSFLMLFAWGHAWAIDWSETATTNGDVTLTSNETIPSGVTVTIKGNLTISASSADVTLTVLGNLIVTGKITIEGCSYSYKDGWRSKTGYRYATIDLRGGNIVCGTWKTDGSMVCTGGGDIELCAYSKIVHTSGTSYVKANNITQNQNAKVVVSSEGTMNIIVVGSYIDNSKSKENSPWGVYLLDPPSNYDKITDGGTLEYDFYVKNNVNLTAKYFEYNDGSDRLIQRSNVVSELKKSGVNEGQIEKQWNEQSSLLPITLTSFTASQNGEGINIEWVTSSEVNNDYFTVEYSTNGVSFKTLETVAGAGTTSEAQEYAISADASLFSGVVYFRLKQTDFNGEYSYSDVIALSVESADEQWYVYPNPTTDVLYVSSAFKTAVIYNAFGTRMPALVDANSINVAQLPVGTYTVVLDGKKAIAFVKK